ncbi:phage tail tape measure protein [Mangrovicella endophytica]|uniref:phage tail tape measure protein n=1 Tax=Mangrovicella endophytica TaxID=2066697 RepID=UPI000C9E72E3|nr:phage tail tape measure protein [Mangrovicella endophytica]
MDADETFNVAIAADTTALDRSLTSLAQKANAFGSAMSGALKGAVSGGRSLDAVLSQLAQRIAAIALDAALKPLGQLAGGLAGQLLSGLGSAFGAPTSGGIVPFAKGGIVAAPSFFPAGNRTGLMGEAGAEAILPLRRGSDGSLGIAAEGGGGRAPTIVFNVTTADAQSFKRSEAQIQAMLARAAQRGRRGL